jgi:uncharacterized membrane protein YfcA
MSFGLVDGAGGVPIPPAALIVVILVIFVGYLVFGVTGFGASPITIPVLAHLLPLTFVLPLAALLDLGSALALGFHTRREADTRELLALVPFTLAGLTLGVTLLVNLPPDATMLALGLFVCAYAIHVMVRHERARRLGRRWAAPAGLVGGVAGALFGMGGPPYVMYITGRVTDPAAQRATISQMVILNVGLRVMAFALAGLLAARPLWIGVALLLPVAWLGVWAGHHVHVRMTPATAARVIGGVLFLSGVTLLLRTF